MPERLDTSVQFVAASNRSQQIDLKASRRHHNAPAKTLAA
jgi:hypothetical protein